MVGSIDPRCETVRGTHWPVKVAGVFGTRVAENHLGQRSKRPASTGRTYGCKRSDQTLKKNSCGTGAVHIWVPAFAGTTTGSMPEMPDAGEHHGDAVIVGGLDDFVVAHRTAGLDHRGGAGFDRNQQAIGERQERV